MGRPTKYDDAYVEQVYRFCLCTNATDDKIAEFFEVDLATISNWKIRHPDFFEAILAGKESADDQVAKSLFELATGTWNKDADGNVKQLEKPEMQAARFWLMNRQKEQWRERRDVRHSSDPDNPMRVKHDFANMDGEELDQFLNQAGKEMQELTFQSGDETIN